MHRNAIGLASIVLVSIAAFAGCGPTTGAGTVPATGTVTMDGRPLSGASVTFQPIGGDARLTSQATTDEAGKFELGTYAGGGKFQPGIAPGKYAVAITKLDTAAIRDTLSPPKNLLPPRYADPASSQLTAEVIDGKPNDFEFPLHSK